MISWKEFGVIFSQRSIIYCVQAGYFNLQLLNRQIDNFNFDFNTPSKKALNEEYICFRNAVFSKVFWITSRWFSSEK